MKLVEESPGTAGYSHAELDFAGNVVATANSWLLKAAVVIGGGIAVEGLGSAAAFAFATYEVGCTALDIVGSLFIAKDLADQTGKTTGWETDLCGSQLIIRSFDTGQSVHAVPAIKRRESASNICSLFLGLMPSDFLVPELMDDGCRDILGRSADNTISANIRNFTLSIQGVCRSHINSGYSDLMIEYAEFLEAVDAASFLCPNITVSTINTTSPASSSPSFAGSTTSSPLTDIVQSSLPGLISNGQRTSTSALTPLSAPPCVSTIQDRPVAYTGQSSTTRHRTSVLNRPSSLPTVQSDQPGYTSPSSTISSGQQYLASAIPEVWPWSHRPPLRHPAPVHAPGHGHEWYAGRRPGWHGA